MNEESTVLPRFSVIILNWNGRRLLQDCLASLRQQTFQDFEVIVVDNGSTDDSVSFVRVHFPEVRVLALESNLGFAAGNNRGVDIAQGENIIFLNNDTEAHPQFMEALDEATRCDPPQIGAWAVKMLRWADRSIIDNCGCGFSSLGTGFQIGSGSKDGPLFSTPAPVFGASGGAGCFRRRVLDDIGLFDEDFYFNNEDVDLNFRHQLAGYRCRFVPEAIVYHHGSATGGVASDFTVYHIHRNKEWVFFKNMPSPLLWRYLFQHLIYAVGWTLYWMMHGKARVILKAKFDAFRGTRSIVTKRRLIQRSSKSDWRVIDGLLDKRSVIDFQKSETLRAIFRLGPARPETGKTSERITGA